MILRCTARMLALLGVGAATLADAPPSDDDWYPNLLWIDRRKYRRVQALLQSLTTGA